MRSQCLGPRAILPAVVGVLAFPIAGLAANQSSDGARDLDQREPHKITICHATGSQTNPYVEITVDEHAVDDRGHDHHQDGRDIIPAPAGGCPTGVVATRVPATATGVPSPTPRPTPTVTPIPVAGVAIAARPAVGDDTRTETVLLERDAERFAPDDVPLPPAPPPITAVAGVQVERTVEIESESFRDESDAPLMLTASDSLTSETAIGEDSSTEGVMSEEIDEDQTATDTPPLVAAEQPSLNDSTLAVAGVRASAMPARPVADEDAADGIAIAASAEDDDEVWGDTPESEDIAPALVAGPLVAPEPAAVAGAQAQPARQVAGVQASGLSIGLLPSTGNPVLDVTAIVLLAVGLAALAVQRLRFRRRII